MIIILYYHHHPYHYYYLPKKQNLICFLSRFDLHIYINIFLSHDLRKFLSTRGQGDQ